MIRTLIAIPLLLPACAHPDRDAETPAAASKPAEPEPAAAAPPATAAAAQTQAEAIGLICDAPDRVEVARIAEPDQSRAMARWIQANVSNIEALRLFETLANTDPTERPAILAAAAKEQGIAVCPFADWLRSSGAATGAP